MTDHSTQLPLRILLIDDNDGDIEMTRLALEDGQTPCELRVAHDGAEALDFLSRHKGSSDEQTPHLILLDLNMPRVSGKRFLEEVKSDPRLRLIPVVVLTSSQAPADVVGSYARHSSGYLVKPFDRMQFVESLQRVADFWGTLMLLPKDSEVEAHIGP